LADRRDKITIPESRICPNCSSPEQHSNFCTNCGVEITPEPDSTGDKPASDEDEIINQEPRTFLNCSPTELNCKNCGFNMENQNDRNFCTSCGFPVPLKLNTPMPALAKAIFPVSATVIVGLVILGIRWLHSNSEFPQDAIGASCGAIGCVAPGDILFLMIGGLGIAIAYLLSKQLGR